MSVSEKGHTANPGDYLVIWIIGMIGPSFIAEVVEFDAERPLEMVLKIQESGPYSRLKAGKFILCEGDSATLQKDNREGTSVFLGAEAEKKRAVISGLKSLGIPDNELHEIPPPRAV